MSTQEDALRQWVAERAEELEVPGTAVGVLHENSEAYAYHGVTSIENPLPVDENTLFQIGSTGKTFTATALMRLVDQGRVDLMAPVRTYVPELGLKDEEVAREVTVLHLLNHTAGWEGDLLIDTGDGDDALERYVEKMATLEQVNPLGAGVAYNNASFSLAGRVIEKVTSMTYEAAVKDLLLEPLGLNHSFFFRNEIMTRRFATGHSLHHDGTITVVRPWSLPRSGAPAGALSSNAKDQITWARFHLGDGSAPSGEGLLPEKLLKQMQEETAKTPLDEYRGIGWLLRDIEGVRFVEHGGTTLGQHSIFAMVPERDFAITSLTNCGPNGPQLNDDLLAWALESYLGLVEKDPEPVTLTDEELREYSGTFETLAGVCAITVDAGALRLDVSYKPEAIADLVEEGQEPPEEPEPFKVGMLPGDGDRYIGIDEGPFKGIKGYFVRDGSGSVASLHLGGRLMTRSGPPTSP